MKHSYLYAITILGAWLTLATTAWAQPTTPTPFIDEVQPTAARLAGPGFILTLKGANFRPGAMVDWQVGNKHECLLTYVISASELVAWVPPAFTAHAATATVTVTNQGPPPQAGQSNTVLIPITRPTANVSFSQSNLPLALNPNAIATGDFNHDGKLDLAVSESCIDATICPTYNGTVAIFLGNGNGTFTTVPGPVVTETPGPLVVGDFNRDGNLDIAVINVQVATVTILLGNGHGGFTVEPVTAATGNNPVAMVTGDINADGNLDLVVANNQDSDLTILLGNGHGGFTAVPPPPVTGQPWKLFLGDLNGDGKLDLVVSTQYPFSANIFLGNGNGTFTAAPTPALAEPPIGLADLNADGNLDLLFAYGDPVPLATTVATLLGNGNGTFRTGPVSPQLSDLSQFGGVIADYNGDGLLDFAAEANYPINGYDFLLGNGHGVFNLNYSTGDVSNNGIGAGVEGDFNGDGRLDLATFDYVNGGEVVILLQQPAP